MCLRGKGTSAQVSFPIKASILFCISLLPSWIFNTCLQVLGYDNIMPEGITTTHIFDFVIPGLDLVTNEWILNFFYLDDNTKEIRNEIVPLS